jgi:hypothetical protein
MDMATDSTQEPIPPADGNDSDSNSSNRDPTELPFLVTHWLSTLYNPQGGKKNAAADTNAAATDTNVEQKEAMDKIRRAAADLASAFSTLGAFGTASRVSIVVVWLVLFQTNRNVYRIVSYLVALVQLQRFVARFSCCLCCSHLVARRLLYLSLYHCNIIAATRLRI